MNQKQELAIEMIIDGKSDQEIARRIKVTRQTVNYWKNKDIDFKVELELRRDVVWQKQRDELTALSHKAIEVIRKNLDNKNQAIQLKAAMELLRMPAL